MLRLILIRKSLVLRSSYLTISSSTLKYPNAFHFLKNHAEKDIVCPSPHPVLHVCSALGLVLAQPGVSRCFHNNGDSVELRCRLARCVFGVFPVCSPLLFLHVVENECTQQRPASKFPLSLHQIFEQSSDADIRLRLHNEKA